MSDNNVNAEGINDCNGFCSSLLTVESNYVDPSTTEYYIECEECTSRSNSYESKEDCIAIWNEDNPW